MLGWDTGTLPVGAEGTVQVVVHVDSVGPDGSLTLAEINSEASDIDGSNNVATDLRALAVGGSSFSVHLYLPEVTR